MSAPAPCRATPRSASAPGPRPLLGERHVDNLELQSVGAAEIDCKVATGSEWELPGSIEDLTTERAYELVHALDLLVLLDVERDVMKTGLVHLKEMGSKLGLSLPNVHRGTVCHVQVHG